MIMYIFFRQKNNFLEENFCLDHQIDMLPYMITMGKVFIFLLKIVNGSCFYFCFKKHTRRGSGLKNLLLKLYWLPVCDTVLSHWNFSLKFTHCVLVVLWPKCQPLWCLQISKVCKDAQWKKHMWYRLNFIYEPVINSSALYQFKSTAYLFAHVVFNVRWIC